MPNEVETPKQCGNPDCKIAQTGNCVEGLPLDRCPHYGRPIKEAAPDSAEALPSIPAALGLPSGDLLKVDDGAAVLRAGKSRVIAIIGPKDAGKTTLIASVYELFQMGAIGNIQFARSRTLFAFERACHHSRAVSLNIIPDTERTILTDVHFYHLGVRVGSAPILDLLLADRAGEEYRSATDDPSAARSFAEILRADVITILVDGRRLLDLSARQAVQSEIVMIIQALIDGGAVSGNQRLAVVLTKTDEVVASDHRARAEQDFLALVTRIEQLFAASFGQIGSFKVAACPSDNRMPRGHGVQGLLENWIDESSVATAQPNNSLPSSPRFIGQLTVALE